MSAIPIGYKSVQGLRRKSVSLLCILLASAMAMGILVYVDSFSIHEWNNQLGSVGSIAMTAEGNGIEFFIDEITAIPGVEKAHTIQFSRGMIFYSFDEFGIDSYYGRFDSPSEDYYEGFPDAYTFISGRTPLNESEIALSRRVIEELEYNVGDIVNYSYEVYNNYGGEWRMESYLLEVVGIFEKESNIPNDWYWYYDSSIGIVVPELLSSWDESTNVDIDIDRTPLSAFDPTASLAYLLNIEQAIRELDPYYDPVRGYGNFWVDDNLAEAVSRYSAWQTNMRLTQLSRASAVLILVALVMFLAIRHNVNERRFESSMLISRGAAKSDIDRRILKEIMGLAGIGAIVGLGLGVLFSRFGLASVGFFEFDWILFFTEPLLISLFSLIISVLIGVVLPYATWIVYQAIYSTRKRVEEHEGKLQKLSRVLIFIRWDVVLLGLSILLLLGLVSAGPLVLYNPFFTMILGYIPLVIFISLGSLSIKALRSGANPLSKVMNRVVGVLPSMIGVRRIGKSASSAGPAILVLVLSMSIAWTYAIIGASMPVTKQNQGRLAFGGDVAFRLGRYQTPAWNNFTANVTNHELAAATSMVSSTEIQLSTG
ncbi:MAG: ABC transporter permease, partial [Candidatus Thorarchaeota archaeon]|nr:ABC transporter permease [Candidatus Thorarchaeota archaeon]